MNRCLAMLFAILCASLSVASACTAAPSDWVEFTLQSRSATVKSAPVSAEEERGQDDNSWSASFAPAQLVGLDVAGFRANRHAPTPLRPSARRRPARLLGPGRQFLRERQLQLLG